MVVEQQQQSGQRQQEQFVVRVVRVFPDYQGVAFINVGVARGVRDSVPVAAQCVEQTRVPGVEQAGFPVRGRDGEIVEDGAEALFLRVDLPQQVAVAAQQVDKDLDVGFERDKPHARALDPVLVVLVREIEPVPQPLEFVRQLRRRRAEQHDVVEQLHQPLELIQGDDRPGRDLLHRAVGSVLPVEIVDIAASEPFCQVRNDCLADAVAAECGHGLWITFMAACRPPGHPVNLGWPLCRNA